MYKFALLSILAVIAAAGSEETDESGETTDPVTTAITMTGKLATADAVWSSDADAYSMSDACFKLSDTYECHSVKVQDGKGVYKMTRSDKLPWSADGITD